MDKELVKGMITCVPLFLVLLAWARIYSVRRIEPTHPPSIVALAVVSALAVLSAATFVYFAFRPSPLPPWQSPEIADFSLLLLLSPIGIVFGLFLFGRTVRAPKWLCWTIEIVSIWLFVIGGMAGAAF